MKIFNLTLMALLLLCTACEQKEKGTTDTEPQSQAMRYVVSITTGDDSVVYSYDKEWLLTSIEENVNDKESYTYDLRLVPIVQIGEASNPTGTAQDPASKSELEFTKEGYLKREVAKNVESNVILRSVIYTYDEQGYLTEITQNESDRKYTRQMEWSDGNLLSIKNEYFFKTMQYSFFEDVTYTYGDQETEPVNHNPLLYIGDKAAIYPTSWYGKPSKNQISSMHTRQYQHNMDSVSKRDTTFNIECEYDSEGYPTTITVHNVQSDTTTTKVIEYAD